MNSERMALMVSCSSRSSSMPSSIWRFCAEVCELVQRVAVGLRMHFVKILLKDLVLKRPRWLLHAPNDGSGAGSVAGGPGQLPPRINKGTGAQLRDLDCHTAAACPRLPSTAEHLDREYARGA